MTALRFIAELSSNASQNLDDALRLVTKAVEAGATAIKVQVWTPGTMAFPGAYTIPRGPWAGRDLADLYRETMLPWEWIKPLQRRASDLGALFGASVFDRHATDMMHAIGADFLKIASFEITDTPLIAHAASTGLPLIISTGMATPDEIDMAAKEAERAAPRTNAFALLACSSSYPCAIEDAHVRRVQVLRHRFPTIEVGYSDHTMGVEAAVAATVLGATIIERHICLDGQRTADSDFSATPDQFRRMADACRDAWYAIGGAAFGPQGFEMPALRRGLHWADDLPAGHVVMHSDMVTARPTSPTPIKDRAKAIGKPLAVAVRRGQPVDLEGQINGG